MLIVNNALEIEGESTVNLPDTMTMLKDLEKHEEFK